ncbi:MAG: hypothetical protein AMXMBFR55_23730 [Gemmatimonadota bacterium]
MSFVNGSVRMAWMRVVALGSSAAVVAGCQGGAGRERAGAVTPDSLPVFAGDSLPFRYPPGPYLQGIQDNVTLRLYLDEFGRPVPESTRIEEHAVLAAFDSSALAGARELVFRPAMKDGKAIPFAILFPVKFRVPGGAPMPGDAPAIVPKR